MQKKQKVINVMLVIVLSFFMNRAVAIDNIDLNKQAYFIIFFKSVEIKPDLYDKKKYELVLFDPKVIYFYDRPWRMTGSTVTSDALLKAWHQSCLYPEKKLFPNGKWIFDVRPRKVVHFTVLKMQDKLNQLFLDVLILNNRENLLFDEWDKSKKEGVLFFLLGAADIAN